MPAQLSFAHTEECMCVCVCMCMDTHALRMNMHGYVHFMYFVDEEK